MSWEIEQNLVTASPLAEIQREGTSNGFNGAAH
jgi:hypothetical protein